jgi:putative ABC transport system permease protein
MGWWSWLRRRLDVLLRKGEVEREMDDEMRFHLEMEIRQHMASGLSREEARRRALVAFGGVERYKEEVRDARGARVLDDLFQDLGVAARSLPKQPIFLVTVLGTLAVGMGGNVAMFGVLDASLLRALPYPEADRLVLGRVTYQGEVGNTVSGPDYFDYEEQVRGLERLAALTPFSIQSTVLGSGDAERVTAPLVSHDLFPALGVDPALGRPFRPEEGEPGGAAVVLVSHGYWERSLGADPSAIGRTLRVDGEPRTIVGVMPAGFRFLVDADIWLPMVRGGAYAGARQFHNFVLVGRLAPGVSIHGAQAEVDGVSSRLAQTYPETNEGKGLNLTPLQDALVEGYRSTLGLLTAAVLVLLLVAGSNVAGLLVARGAARRSEMAVRSVMGAGRGRLARQLLAENALLAVAGAALAVLLASWMQRAILGFVPMQTLGPIEAGLSARMLGAALGFTVLTLALFGVLPAVRVAGADPARSLRSGARTAGGVGTTRARSALVVTQVALTAVLLVVSGLLIRSFAEIRGVDPGFDTNRLLTARVALPPAEYEDAERRVGFFEELRRRVAQTPGVAAVGLTTHVPIRDTGGNVRVAPPEEWGSEGVFGRIAYQRIVMPGTFDALRIPILAGRDVEPTDDRTSANVMVVSESLAASLFPDGSSPLGRTVGMDVGSEQPWLAEIVGVVGDVTPSSLTGGTGYSMYLSYGQRTPAGLTLAVRTTASGTDVTPALRAILSELDPDVPLASVLTMDEVLASSVSGQRSVTLLIVGFASLALLLAAIGLYGVLAYQVARRLHEIGVRMALGASTSSVSREVLRGGLVLVGLGLALGLPSALLATRLVQGMLFEVGGLDPLTYAGVTVFLAAVAGLACLVPARRAARVDPVKAFSAG